MMGSVACSPHGVGTRPEHCWNVRVSRQQVGKCKPCSAHRLPHAAGEGRAIFPPLRASSALVQAFAGIVALLVHTRMSMIERHECSLGGTCSIMNSSRVRICLICF